MLSPHPHGTVLEVHATPGAKRTAIAGLHGAVLKIRLAARPVEGAANTELLSFLARHLGLAPTRLTLLSGQTSRAKRILIIGLSPADLAPRFPTP